MKSKDENFIESSIELNLLLMSERNEKINYSKKIMPWNRSKLIRSIQRKKRKKEGKWKAEKRGRQIKCKMMLSFVIWPFQIASSTSQFFSLIQCYFSSFFTLGTFSGWLRQFYLQFFLLIFPNICLKNWKEYLMRCLVVKMIVFRAIEQFVLMANFLDKKFQTFYFEIVIFLGEWMRFCFWLIWFFCQLRKIDLVMNGI